MSKVIFRWSLLLLALFGLAVMCSLSALSSIWYVFGIAVLSAVSGIISTWLSKAIKGMKAYEQSGMFWLFTLSFLSSLGLFVYSYLCGDGTLTPFNWKLIGMLFSVLLFLISLYMMSKVFQVIGQHIP